MKRLFPYLRQHTRLIGACFFMVFALPAVAQPSGSQLVAEGERLARQKETARSLLTLNRFIEGAAGRPLTHADSLLLLRAVSQNAQNYQTLGNAHQSLAFFQRAITLATALNEPRRLATLYNNVFSIYFTQQEYAQAEELLARSLAINKQLGDSAAIRNNYNNFGLVSLDHGQYDRALSYLNQALALTPAADPIGRSLIMTNRADIYSRQGRYAQAEHELAQALHLQRGFPVDAHTIQTSLNMTLLQATLGRRAEAGRLQPAIYHALPRLPLSVQSNSLVQLADIHFILGDSIAALHDILRFQSIDDSLKRTTNTSQLQQLLVAYDTDRLRQANDTLKQTVAHRTTAFIVSALVLLVLLALVGLLVRRMRVDKQKSRLINEQQARLLHYEQQEHERKQQELSSELDHKNRQLTTYTLDLASINEFHQRIAQSLNALQRDTEDSDEAKALRGVVLSLQHFNDKPLGDDFRIYFDEVHPGFLQKLSERHHLSKADLRLCAYLYLGMTTKEIAALTYKEVRSVESQRNRLRKKLDLQPGYDLSEYFKEIATNN